MATPNLKDRIAGGKQRQKQQQVQVVEQPIAPASSRSTIADRSPIIDPPLTRSQTEMEALRFRDTHKWNFGLP